MTLNLRDSFGISVAAHAVIIVGSVGVAAWLSPSLPPIMEITLVAGPESKGGTPAAAVEKAKPGGEGGTSLVKSETPARGGQVVVATPEFVPVGRRPERSGDALMGDSPGAGGGAPGAGDGGPGAAGGTGRRVRYQEPLEYPDWAKEKGIVAKVVLRFKVLPDGSVDSQVILRRTSGWRQLDELAIKAMRNYLFERLPPGTPQVPQWGEVALSFVAE